MCYVIESVDISKIHIVGRTVSQIYFQYIKMCLTNYITFQGHTKYIYILSFIHSFVSVFIKLVDPFFY